jgi:DHA1 family tetracycline resistance protein-like MFS transporter
MLWLDILWDFLPALATGPLRPRRLATQIRPMNAPQRKRAFTFILITLTLDAMGIGLIVPVMPDSSAVNGGPWAPLRDLGRHSGDGVCSDALIFGPILGLLSDRYMDAVRCCWISLPMSLDYLVMVGRLHLAVVRTRIIGGITAATMATARLYRRHFRARRKIRQLRLIGAAFGLGFILGLPWIGGSFANSRPCAVLCRSRTGTANLIFGYYVLPETVIQITPPVCCAALNPFGAFKALAT